MSEYTGSQDVLVPPLGAVPPQAAPGMLAAGYQLAPGVAEQPATETPAANAGDPDAYVPEVDTSAVQPAAPDNSYVPAGTPSADAVPPPGKGLLQDEPFLTRAWRSVKDAFTGESQIPDVMKDTPELTQRSDLPTDAGIKIASQYLLSGDPDSVAATAAKALPGATVGADKFGNPTVTWNGKTSYVNKPGLSAADIIGDFGDAALAFPVAKGIAAVKALGGIGWINTLVRSGVQGAGQAGLSILRDLGSYVLGSDKGVDVGKAVQAGVGGAAAEPAVAAAGTIGRAVNRGVTSMLPATNLFTDAATGLAGDTPLTPNLLNTTGRKFLSVAGVQPGELTLDQMRNVATMMPRGTSDQIFDGSDGASRTALNMVRSAQFKIPYTLGELTGDKSQLGREDWLRRTNTSPSARAQLTQFDEQRYGDPRTGQPGAVGTAANAQVPPLPGQTGPAASTPAEQGQMLQQQILALRGQQQAATDAAYTAVGAPLTKPGMQAMPLNQQLIFGKQASQDLLDQLAALRRTRALPQSAIDRITQLTGGGPPASSYVAGTGAGDQVATKPFNLGDFNETRRYVQGLPAPDASTKAALGGITDAMDSAVDNATTAGTVLGDPAMLARYQTARDTARAQFQNFRPDNDAARNFVDTVQRPGVSGTDIVDGLLGGGRLGFGGQTTEILDHLVGPGGMFPAGSDAYETLRAAAARRMIFGTDMNPATMTPNNIINRIANVTDPASKGSEIAARLFSPDELKQFSDFGDSLKVLTQSATRNPSGTAYAIADAVKRLGSKLPSFLGNAFNDEASSIADARRATTGTLAVRTPRPTDMPISSFRNVVAPAIGGAAGRQGYVAPAASALGTGLMYVPSAIGQGARRARGLLE